MRVSGLLSPMIETGSEDQYQLLQNKSGNTLNICLASKKNDESVLQQYVDYSQEKKRENSKGSKNEDKKQKKHRKNKLETRIDQK